MQRLPILMLILAIVIVNSAKHEKLGDTYTLVKGSDAPGLDLFDAGTSNITELEEICSLKKYCAGFNSNGWLKYDVSNPVPADVDLYIRSPAPPPFKPAPFTVWPQPSVWTAGTTTLSVTFSSDFFQSVGTSSIKLTKAFDRYKLIIFGPVEHYYRFSGRSGRSPRSPKSPMRIETIEDLFENGYTLATNDESQGVAELVGCDVNVLTSDETLQLGFDESYEIYIPSAQSGQVRATLTSNTVYGALRGLETLAQLISYTWESAFFVNFTPINITDFPRYAHRSLLIDTARHFLPMYTILKGIDAMAATKLNTLHWHIVDIQSFPYVSTTFPLLSQKGAYDPIRAVYTPEDVQRVISYAADRGIRVMPEFDMPAHTDSWFAGYPFLKGGADCGFDPTLDTTYDFIDKFLSEIVSVFPENYIHLGGDELSFGCWQTTPIENWMKSHNISTISALEAYFESKVLAIAAKHNAKVMVWQDVFNNGVRPVPGTVIEVWEGSDFTTLIEVLQAGYPAVMSGFWYLDSLADTWADYYVQEVDNGEVPQNLLKLVIGGEACMWGEWVDQNNFIPRVFPRATAVAEVLWSPEDFPKITTFAGPRLHQWKCRMNRRGINVEPVGVTYASFCDPL